MKTTIKFICLLFLSLVLSCSSDDDNPAPIQYNLNDIQGDWYRVGGNNPEYNGMLVNVANDIGTVRIPAASAFNIGDIKWKNIIGQANRTYTHNELGSDASYYDATMKLGVDDTLRVFVGTAGSGNEQKWVRQFAERDDCRRYQVGDFSNAHHSSWEEVNETHSYPGLIPAVSDPGGGYYTVTLTNGSGIIPGLSITSSNDDSGAISSGTAAGSRSPTERKCTFLVHPGVSYDVTAHYSSYIVADGPVDYIISWTFTGKMDCYEQNDYIGGAKFIPKNEPIEAYAITGYTMNYNKAGDPQTFDFYKVQVFEPAKLKMELLQVPETIKLRVSLLSTEGVNLGVHQDVISGHIDADGGLFYTTTNREVQPGTYIVKIEVAGTRKTVINQFNNEIIPDHWKNPYKFKVTTE